jgi:hypothetical protein
VVFSDTPVFSNNKTDSHDITEILLKVALNTIILTVNFGERHKLLNPQKTGKPNIVDSGVKHHNP